jgi:hypothetical protein
MSHHFVKDDTLVVVQVLNPWLVRGVLYRLLPLARRGARAEVFGDSLFKKLETAANVSLARLFPEFSDGDHL